jgi:DNA helicase-2/ATP-dependent DNA helicase PcrA
MIDYNGLNPEQRQAVFLDHRRLLCLAGAGTGKTQVLTRRIARLWEAGASPENMLALTFTRAAGAEMKERVIGLIGKCGRKLFCNTFHAFCVEVIRENAEALGYDENFSIYDQEESNTLLLEVLDDLRVNVTGKLLRQTRAGDTAGMSATQRMDARRAIREYDNRLKRNNALDFDGLINTVKSLLRDSPETRERYRARYTHVFVDEFQDTDPEQWAIVSLLDPENLFIVGDDFQAIYGFRGSDIKIILALAQDPAWHTVKLEQNYRSTAPIVAAANALIKRNTQTEKKLVAQTDGPPVEYRQPQDEDAEIAELESRLNRNIEAGVTTAVLARTNKQLERARMILNSLYIPCTEPGDSFDPLRTPGAKAVFAWIAALENPEDGEAMKLAAATVLTRADINKIESLYLDNYGGGKFTDYLDATAAGKALRERFRDARTTYLIGYEVSRPVESVHMLMEQLNISAFWLTNAIRSWEARQNELGEPATMRALLDLVRIRAITGRPAVEILPDKIHLMTVHGSKGLEFDEVHVIGMTHGGFPGRGNIEEERRLFYVALTRARRLLTVSCPRTSFDWSGKPRPTEESQFLREAQII